MGRAHFDIEHQKPGVLCAPLSPGLAPYHPGWCGAIPSGVPSGKKAPVPTDPEHEVLAIRCSTV